MSKPCDYCGCTDWGCENEAQVVACEPSPVYVGVDYGRKGGDVGCEVTVLYRSDGTFVVEDIRYLDPTPRQLLAAAIRGTSIRDKADRKDRLSGLVLLPIEDARAILQSLQEAERRELHSTLGGEGMP